MRTGEEILHTYEGVLAITGQMLASARRGDWDGLIELESRCRHLVEGLMRVDQASALDEPQRQRKAHILRKVLADDAEIRNLTQSWMHELGQLLGTVGRQRQLDRAYGPRPGL